MPSADVAARDAAKPLVLTIDVGTSSARVQLYDARARAVRDVACQVQYQAQTSSDGGIWFDVPELERQVVEAIDRVLQAAGEQAAEVRAVATSTIWHSMLGVDSSHAPVTPLYTWADTRSEPAVEKLKRMLDDEEVHRRTGCVLHTSYFPAKLLWIRETQPETWRKVWRWLSFGEYLYLKCFGTCLCSLSMASGTGLLNQHDRQWDEPMLRALELDAGRLSPLGDLDRPAKGLEGDYARRWPALADVPWYAAVGDGAASNVGCGCTTPERLALMVGTSAAMRVVRTAEDVEVPRGVWCYRIDARRFVLGGALSNGGNLVSWLTNTIRIDSLEQAERELAAAEPDGHGLTVLPFLAGERSPNWAGYARAAIVGLSLHSRPIDILQAGLESVAYRVALIYDLLRPVASSDAEIVASGGALLNSPAWVQIMADVLGRPVTASAEAEASSRGVALLALEQLGAIESIESAPAELGARYDPRPNHHERYGAARERQQRLYARLIRDRWDVSPPGSAGS